MRQASTFVYSCHLPTTFIRSWNVQDWFGCGRQETEISIGSIDLKRRGLRQQLPQPDLP